MRIRRKKHLAERLDAVKDLFIVADKKIINVVEAVKDKKYFDFFRIFGNENPVELDIGCGKGGFITQLASENPEKNYIGVEKMENIALLAAELAKKKGLSNVRFVNSGAEYLPRYIPEGTVERIYLNFSPPFPRKSNENRRLTNPKFVRIYNEMLAEGGEIFQKTDDKAFFDYSFESMRDSGFEVNFVLAAEINRIYGGAISEYEKNFLLKQSPIYILSAKKS